MPRPRDRLALAEDSGFNHARQQVLNFLYAKQRNPAVLAQEAEEDAASTNVTPLRSEDEAA